MNCKGALQALFKMGWGGGGNDGAEGRGKDELQEEGDESARQKRARVFAYAVHPSPRSRAGAPGLWIASPGAEGEGG